MSSSESRHIKYFHIRPTDEAWGIVVTTVGYQEVPAHSSYPRSRHPESHLFNPEKGRVLKEYQLVYISKGRGYFESASSKKQQVEAGTMILLFPNEWHTYEPDKKSGWFEYWVGFRGIHIDKRVENGFFTKKSPIYPLKFSSGIIGLYEDIVNYAMEEKSGYQQIISSIVLYLLGMVYFKNRNSSLNDSFAVNKINEARSLMRQEMETNISPKVIAEHLGVSYSWFRKMFKKYVDVSPAQYQANLRFLRSKELLDTTSLSITEIAYRLHFESTGQFSTFFHKREGIPPLQYRKIKNESRERGRIPQHDMTVPSA